MQGFYQQDNALIWESNHETVRIEPWGRDSLRVRATVEPAIRDDLPGALLDPAPTSVQIEIGSERATIRNGAMMAEVSQTGWAGLSLAGKIRFLNAVTGAELLEEEHTSQPSGWPPSRYFKAVSGGLFRLEARFKAYDDERLYGLGQQVHGRLNQKGCVVELLHRNTQETIPFLVSSRGYGFLWHNPAVGRVQLGYDRTLWVAEAAHQMDYWITAGDTPAEILEHYVDATGHAPVLPEWAAGFWQCKLRYRTQEELLSIAREYKRRGLPLSVIVIDFFHWSAQGDWQFDSEKWPDPTAMVRELEEMGVKVMVSIWPTVSTFSANFLEMQQRGLLVRAENGMPVHMLFVDTKPAGPVYLQYYDATHPEARQYLWERVREGYYRHGIKVFWLDEAEPDMWPTDPGNLRYHLGNGLTVTNLYPLLHARGFYEAMRAEGETEICNLARSAWAGSQRYGAAVWSGDIQSTWESLRVQVRAGLNIGLSGIPWWTTDIGGFFNGDPESPYFRELIVRWFQYGAFCPLFRLHGFRAPAIPFPVPEGGPNEVWSFGDEAYAIIKELLFLRERLRPYLMEQMRLASQKGIPPMRPLFVDFPGDQGSWAVEDQFMFGPDLLVAPVLYEGARSRQVYLPAGDTWTDVWTDKILDGGQWITTDAPLERIPLYLRGDAKLLIKA
jgi:alpha-D-xyloside xylohydrolase